jgi:phytoene desaturase
MGRSIAIVGAGPGGLAAAVLLAAQGRRVTVYESQPAIGGRTGRLESGGYRFDRGPTFFMMPYVLEEIFGAAGKRLADHVQLTRLDPMYRLIIGQPGGAGAVRIDARQDLEAMVRRLEALCPGDGEGFRRFIDHNRHKLRAMTPVLRRSFTGLSDFLRLDGLQAGLALRPWRSLYAHLGTFFKHEATRLAMGFQSKYLGMSPFECPELFSILSFIEYEYGIWHPEGGCHALMLALGRVAEEMGVEIRCGEAVEALRFQKRRVTGVCAAGQWQDHDHVIINADATWALKRLVPETLRGRQTDSAIDSWRYSCSTFMMYLGVRGAVDLPHHTIYTSADYRRNLADIGEGCTSSDPSIYVCNPSGTDPTLAPPGCSSLYVLLPTANTRCAIDWEAQRSVLRRSALDQLAATMGLHDLERRIEREITFTPEQWRGLNINHGAVFNLAHTLPQMLHRRPQHRVPGVDGLWLVGGGTHPGSGLPVIFLSAQITAELVGREG